MQDEFEMFGIQIKFEQCIGATTDPFHFRDCDSQCNDPQVESEVQQRMFCAQPKWLTQSHAHQCWSFTWQPQQPAQPQLSTTNHTLQLQQSNNETLTVHWMTLQDEFEILSICGNFEQCIGATMNPIHCIANGPQSMIQMLNEGCTIAVCVFAAQPVDSNPRTPLLIIRLSLIKTYKTPTTHQFLCHGMRM